MAKRGEKRHRKRIASPKIIPIHDKKASVWLSTTTPGPHPSERSMPLVVLIRDVLGFARTSKEAKMILNKNLVLIDGKVRKDLRFPVGFMDIISFPVIQKTYQLTIERGKLIPKETSAKEKILKVVNKYTLKKGKIAVGLHDGRNLIADNNLRIGDSVKLTVPDGKLSAVLKLEKDATCLVTHGKYAGTVVKLEEIVERKGGRSQEALVSKGEERFTTLASYLFVLGDTND
ncbi:30S ribosomal protein S4e [Candidatus Micrarchaeota archaeon]|nr:30S ribosomal protein S4e [Candidatus Micrarchaeota archaeon]